MTDTRQTVLIIDDDELMRMMITEALIALDFNVVEAENGERGLALFQEVKPHLIVLDLLMPGIDGIEVCRRLRALPDGRHVPIVMVTGQDDRESIDQTFAAGATDFIAKPITWSMLPHRVKFIMQSADALKQSIENEEHLRNALARSSYLEHHDAMTGLLNLAGYEAALEQESALAARQQRNVPVMLVSLTRLRRLREGFGHTLADLLLKAAVGRLLNVCAAQPLMPLLVRITTDEVAIVLREALPTNALIEVAEKILSALAELIELNGQTYRLQPVGGLAMYPQDGDSSETVLKAARAALQAGGSEERLLHFYDPGREAALTRRLRLEEDLLDVLDKQQLEVHYQPLVRISDRRPVGVEALLRWQHPQLGLISPMEFIPLIEENGMIHEVGAWVMRVACQQAARWRADGFMLNEMAINISGVQLTEPGFIKRVQYALDESGLPPAHLVLELTESVLVHEDEIAIAQLKSLKALGLRLALDDFGTGFSSMVSLTRLPLDVVKVDKSFVQAAPTQPTAAAVVEAILALAGRLGMETVAEGVENSAHFEFLTHFGCTKVQGYMFQKPRAADQIVAHLSRSEASSPSSAQPAQPLKVMVVDDSRLSRMMLASLIKSAQPTALVIEIDDPRNAAASALQEAPDLVILDMNMPGMNGMEVAAQLRPSLPALDIAMLTANFQDSVVKQAHDLHLRFFAKPITENIVAGILAPYGRRS